MNKPLYSSSHDKGDLLFRYGKLYYRSCLFLFVSYIIEAVYSLFPPGSRSPASKPVKYVPSPWWTQECQQTEDKRRDANRKYYRVSSSENFDAYKREGV